MKSLDRKLYGILICAIVGGIVLVASLIGSMAEQPTIRGSELVDFGADWQVEAGEQSYSDVRLPALIGDPVAPGRTMVLEKSLPIQIEGNTNLFFRASHQKVKVSIGDHPVYRFGWDDERLFGKTPASTWVIIPLTEAENGARVKIELTGVYERYTNKVNEMYIGDKSAILREIFDKRAGSVLIGLVLMVLGVGMLAISAVLRNGKITASLLRLGILSFIVGIWSICVTNTLQILYGNVYFLLNFEFFAFDLLLPVFIWFLLSFQHYKEQRWLQGIFWASVAEFLLIEILQVTGIADYMESIIITHVMMVGVMFFIIIAGIRDLLRRQATSEEKISLAAVLMLLVFAGIDLVRFYQVDIVDEGFYTRIGTLLFVGLWSMEVIRNISRQFVYMAKTEALEVLAYEDLMTGLKNRTAFEERLNDYERITDNDDAYLIAFDMNGLKEINDQYGHMKGDQAIVTIAHIIKEAFEKYGTCYRTGGDEICTILTGTELSGEERLREILQLIDTAIETESKAMNIEFSVAAGYSKASITEKRDIYRAYREADRRMYACKHKMKGKSRSNET